MNTQRLYSMYAHFLKTSLYGRALLVSAIWILLFHSPLHAAEKWTTLTNCQLVDSNVNDGDSFKVKHGKKTSVFRLYYVDTPETVDTYPERVEAQAKYFDSTKSKMLRLGKTATEFTKEYLQEPFTIYTLWEDAAGNSKRYYAIVETKDGLLIEALVENGLARIYGKPAEWPGSYSSRRYWKRLSSFERKAKKANRGGWR